MASTRNRLGATVLGGLLAGVVLEACGQEEGGGVADPKPPAAAPAPSPPPPPVPKPAAPKPPSPVAPAAAAPAPQAPEPTAPLARPAAVKDDGTTVTVTLTANDALQYGLKEIRVAAGRRIRLTLKHIGLGPKATMGHNFVLLAAGTDMTTFGVAASTARSTGYIPANLRDRVLAHTEVIGGGESTTIEFDAPAPGSYDYLCSFVGHFAVMNGKLIVE